MRKLLASAAVCMVALTYHADAQVTLSRLPVWMAGGGDCNHAIYNNMTTPCNDSSPTGDNDSEYFSYYKGLIFQPRLGGLPSYFTPNGDFVLQGQGTFNNTVQVNSPALGSTAGTSQMMFQLQGSDLSNTSYLIFSQVRNSTGTDWFTATTRIRQRIDATDEGYIDFNPPNGSYGLAFGSGSSEMMRLIGGNVGVGTTAPGARLEVNGSLKLTAGAGASMTYSDGTVQSTAWTGVLSGGDYAESVNIATGKAELEPGDLVVIDHSQIGKFVKSSSAYSTLIGGVYATKPGVTGRRQAGRQPGSDEIPMAMVGIVPTKVSAENGPIQQGDLLVSSSTPGYAMRGTDHDRMMGAVIGKALAPLAAGSGVIEVLISLQ